MLKENQGCGCSCHSRCGAKKSKTCVIQEGEVTGHFVKRITSKLLTVTHRYHHFSILSLSAVPQTWCIKAQHQGFGHFISISLCEDVQLGWDFQFYNTHRFSDSCNLPLIWMLMGTGHIMFTSYIYFCSLLMLEHLCHQLCLHDVVWHICSMIRLRQLYVMLGKLNMSIENGQLHVICKLLHFQSWEWKKMPRICWKKVLRLIAGGWTHGPLKITL